MGLKPAVDEAGSGQARHPVGANDDSRVGRDGKVDLGLELEEIAVSGPAGLPPSDESEKSDHPIPLLDGSIEAASDVGEQLSHARGAADYGQLAAVHQGPEVLRIVLLKPGQQAAGADLVGEDDAEVIRIIQAHP